MAKPDPTDKLIDELVVEALGNFSDVFEHLPPYQRKDLMRLVLHKAIVGNDRLELALHGKPPELSHMTQGAARSQTPDWLPGLASGSVVLWDRVALKRAQSPKGQRRRSWLHYSPSDSSLR